MSTAVAECVAHDTVKSHAHCPLETPVRSMSFLGSRPEGLRDAPSPRRPPERPVTTSPPVGVLHDGFTPWDGVDPPRGPPEDPVQPVTNAGRDGTSAR